MFLYIFIPLSLLSSKSSCVFFFFFFCLPSLSCSHFLIQSYFFLSSHFIIYFVLSFCRFLSLFLSLFFFFFFSFFHCIFLPFFLPSCIFPSLLFFSSRKEILSFKKKLLLTYLAIFLPCCFFSFSFLSNLPPLSFHFSFYRSLIFILSPYLSFFFSSHLILSFRFLFTFFFISTYILLSM